MEFLNDDLLVNYYKALNTWYYLTIATFICVYTIVGYVLGKYLFWKYKRRILRKRGVLEKIEIEFILYGRDKEYSHQILKRYALRGL